MIPSNLKAEFNKVNNPTDLKLLHLKFDKYIKYYGTPKILIKIIDFILHRLKRFRDEVEQGVNTDLPHKYGSKRFDEYLTTDEWLIILNKMIVAFEIANSDELIYDKDKIEEDNKKYQEGIKLFAMYMRDLWW